jgi:hypothetical protein
VGTVGQSPPPRWLGPLALCKRGARV